MRDMPLALAWFLGSIFMLAGFAGAWILRSTNRENATSLRSRVPTDGTLTRYNDHGSSDDWGRLGCTIEYEMKGQRYQISCELNPHFHPVGQRIALMVIADKPSDAVLRDDLALNSFRWPIAVFLIGAAILAWGYIEEAMLATTSR